MNSVKNRVGGVKVNVGDILKVSIAEEVILIEDGVAYLVIVDVVVLVFDIVCCRAGDHV